jgi:hypothetical protein
VMNDKEHRHHFNQNSKTSIELTVRDALKSSRERTTQ